MTAIGFVVWHIKQHVILAVEKDLSPDMVICVHQKPEGYLKGALDLTRVGCDFGQGGNNPKKGRHAVSADSIETRQSSQELNVLGPNSDFLFGFPQRRLRDGLAAFRFSARKGNLSRMGRHGLWPLREDDVPAIAHHQRK